PDWRVSGASTLTSAQPAIRLTGASRLDAGDAPPSSCLKTGQRSDLKPRATPEDRTDGGTSFSRLCEWRAKWNILYYTHTSCGHPYRRIRQNRNYAASAKKRRRRQLRLQDDGKRAVRPV
ncbi:MAG: hypothetical protein KDI90_08750, partial [Alphaproteobacteria bacterium]|nr:hypothetical protein [Alphaproteobacteria bacterium]